MSDCQLHKNSKEIAFWGYVYKSPEWKRDTDHVAIIVAIPRSICKQQTQLSFYTLQPQFSETIAHITTVYATERKNDDAHHN
jgi:hypothetical protein